MKIGFIGLGIMGESMSENLIKKSGYPVYVFDLDSNKVDELVSKGAQACTSATQVVEVVDVVFSMVPKSEHVKALANDIKGSLKRGQIWVDMSTIDPSVSANIATMLESTGCIFLDAPVVKSKAAAIEGTLGIYVGGNLEAYERVKPLLACMGSNIIHMGKNGNGLAMKIVHNMLVGEIQNGVNEMFVLANAMGLNLADVPTAISYGGGQNFYLDGKANAILNNNYTTAFSVENMAKDINIASHLASTHHIKLDGLEVVRKVYEEALEDGYGKEDFSATYKVKSK